MTDPSVWAFAGSVDVVNSPYTPPEAEGNDWRADCGFPSAFEA